MAGHAKRYIILGLILVVVGFAVALAAADARYGRLDQAIQVIAQVKMRYVEQVSAANLFRAYLRTGTIDGMLATLSDPYTRFLKPADYRELRVQTNGTFGGIGVILNHQDKSIVIMKAIKIGRASCRERV